jgi:putative DNA methylase
MTSTYRKKLIEVALPLEAINVASAREKSIRHGHPSTLHLWWARRPLAACRAVLFASLVNDPEDDPMYGINEDVAFTERAKLFDLIEELVQWDNSNNPRVINAARLEIARSIAANKVADKELNDDTPLVANAPKLPDEQTKYLPESPPEYTPRDIRFKMPSLKPEQINHFLILYAPPVLDPFAGGGSIPLEAQRLGLRAYASDLNPVPVLINKALIEIPPKFAGKPSINPESRQGNLKNKQWRQTEGLADDVTYYGNWIREEAEKQIGHFYPKVTVTNEMAKNGRPDLIPYVGRELTVVAWVWARTVRSPNPVANGMHVPLINSYWLSQKKSRETYIWPIKKNGNYHFEIRIGQPSPEELTLIDSGTKLSRGCNFKCLISDQPMPEEHVKAEGMAGNLSSKLLAIVCEGDRSRVYLPATDEHEKISNVVLPNDISDIEAAISLDKRALWCLLYGLTTFDKLFTARQLLTLSTFSDLVSEARNKANKDSGGNSEYADAIATFLAFGISRSADFWSNLCTWAPQAKNELVAHVFGRQALPMVWDYAEANPFSSSGGNFEKNLSFVVKIIHSLGLGCCGSAVQRDATSEIDTPTLPLLSTDPPYYDNIGYSDLADFFYVWLRRTLKTVYPQLTSTMVTPKSAELIASPYRHGNSGARAKEFFEEGLGKALQRFREFANDAFPLSIFYAFKQSESDSSGHASTGWETFLTGIISAEFAITGTWPMRTERDQGLKSGTNVLASSIVLVCRPRDLNASHVTRRDFANALHSELPEAIKHLQSGNVAPVDLAQASIGPGMAVFSRYSRVINADGSAMTVREALQLINQVLDESLVEQESDFDSETRFALKWFEQYGLGEGPFGDAENLSKAMAVSVKGIEDAGILRSKAGKVRLLKREELDPDWDPASDTRLTMWEVTQHLIRTLEADGESGTADLLRRIGSEKGDIARELAYRLYQTCERKSLAKEAGAYNGLVVSWPEISRLSRQKSSTPKQSELELTD